MRNLFVLSGVLIILGLVGCGQPVVENNNVTENFNPGLSDNSVEVSNAKKSGYTLAEVASHNTKQDCWLVIEGKVLDVTDFVSKHPGGEAILQGCGKDATELFNTRPMGSGTSHSEGARVKMTDYYIADLIQ